MTSERVRQPIFSGPDDFDRAYRKVVQMHGLIEPVDITYEDEETNYATRVRVQAFANPPRLLKTTILFEEVNDGDAKDTAIDREFEEHSIVEGQVVVSVRAENQERTMGEDGKLPTLWRGPEEPILLEGRERDVAFTGLMNAIDDLS